MKLRSPLPVALIVLFGRNGGGRAQCLKDTEEGGRLGRAKAKF